MKRFLLSLTAALIGATSLLAETAPLKIGYSDWPGWTAWEIAKEKGFFKKHGVTVDLVWFPVYTDSLNALNAGQVDANCQTWNDTLVPLAQGLKQVAVLANDNSAGNDAIVVRPEIKSVKDLKGKKVATELGTVDHFMLQVALAKNGMSEKDIQFVPMPVPDAAAAFIKGTVDACAVWQPSLDLALTEGKGKLIFTSKDIPGLIPDLLVFQEKVVQTRPKEIQGVVNAWFDVLDFIQKNPKEAVAIMAKKADVKPERYAALLPGTKFFDLKENLIAFEKRADDSSLYGSGATISKFLIDQKAIEKVPDYAAAINSTFVKAVKK
jgi:NitT/TauT family transport system substrate-binding protein